MLELAFVDLIYLSHLTFDFENNEFMTGLCKYVTNGLLLLLKLCA